MRLALRRDVYKALMTVTPLVAIHRANQTSVAFYWLHFTNRRASQDSISNSLRWMLPLIWPKEML